MPPFVAFVMALRHVIPTREGFYFGLDGGFASRWIRPEWHHGGKS